MTRFTSLWDGCLSQTTADLDCSHQTTETEIFSWSWLFAKVSLTSDRRHTRWYIVWQYNSCLSYCCSLHHNGIDFNYLYIILDSKKTTRSQFSVPGLRDIHRNLKQEKNFNSRESFFRKSPFCTFSCINPGFGGPWDKLWKKFLIAISIML